MNTYRVHMTYSDEPNEPVRSRIMTYSEALQSLTRQEVNWRSQGWQTVQLTHDANGNCLSFVRALATVPASATLHAIVQEEN